VIWARSTRISVVPQAPDSCETPVASRTDPATGVTECIGFFGSGPMRLFGCRYLPPGDPIAGVVICSPIHAEMERLYRTEVLLARALAARGLAVQRFHYRGTGHSDGDAADLSYTGMQEDTQAAVDHLRSAGGVRAIGYLGSRFGSLLAGAASRIDGAPLSLWQPLANSSEYFRQAARVVLASDLLSPPQDGRGSRVGLPEILRERGEVDVVGYSLHRVLYDSAENRTLADEVGDRPRPVLIAQISRRTSLQTNIEALVEGWRRQDFDVDVRLLKGEEAWWLVGENQPVGDRSDSGLVSETARWFSQALAGL
jgi:hypothetical protein